MAVWSAAEDATGVVAYVLHIDGEPAVRLGSEILRYALDDLDLGEHHVTIVAVDAAGNESPALEARTGDGTPPSFGDREIQVTAVIGRLADEPQAVSVLAGGAEDESGIAAYVVRIGGEEVRRVTPEEAYGLTIEDVDLRARPTFTIVAIDNAGNESEPQSTSDALPPGFPTGAELELVTAGPAGGDDPEAGRLSWPPATDDVAVTAYVITKGREEVGRLGPDILAFSLESPLEPAVLYQVHAYDEARHSASLRYVTPGASGEPPGRIDAVALRAILDDPDVARQIDELLMGGLQEEMPVRGNQQGRRGTVGGRIGGQVGGTDMTPIEGSPG
ncbi:MAG: hypothetical protein DRJ42_22975 [Deltaproteobacteria bacterium]|nr:MAG: hypothetical protein DRJ42_22975 [Deltaproteobacteria bacterium]